MCGGESRQQSVKNGLERVPANAETVLIHDGARPFVTDEIICSVISALGTHNAVTCAVKLKDTVKQVDKNGYAGRGADPAGRECIRLPCGS